MLAVDGAITPVGIIPVIVAGGRVLSAPLGGVGATSP